MHVQYIRNIILGCCVSVIGIGVCFSPALSLSAYSDEGASPAQGPTGSTGNTGPTGSTGNPGPSGSTGSGGCAQGELCNPIQTKSVNELLMKIIDVLLVFAMPIVLFFILYAGYLFVTARGDSGQLETARNALLWSVVGGVIIFGAKLIITIVENTAKSI